MGETLLGTAHAWAKVHAAKVVASPHHWRIRLLISGVFWAGMGWLLSMSVHDINLSVFIWATLGFLLVVPFAAYMNHLLKKAGG